MKRYIIAAMLFTAPSAASEMMANGYQVAVECNIATGTYQMCAGYVMGIIDMGREIGVDICLPDDPKKSAPMILNFLQRDMPEFFANNQEIAAQNGAVAVAKALVNSFGCKDV